MKPERPMAIAGAIFLASICAPALADPPASAGPDVPGLFYTPAQRAALFEGKPAVAEKSTPSAEAIALGGIWKGPGGRRYIILNGQSVVAGDRIGATLIEAVASTGVKLRQPNEREGRWLRVGEEIAPAVPAAAATATTTAATATAPSAVLKEGAPK